MKLKIILVFAVAIVFVVIPVRANSNTVAACQQTYDPAICGSNAVCQAEILQEQSSCILALETTTTLTFDGFPPFTVLTTQYAGVTFANAYTLASASFPPVSGTNVAANNGNAMSFAFNPAVIGGNVQTVSMYVTDTSTVSIAFYDSANNLLLQTTVSGTNVPVSFTSLFSSSGVLSGNPIASVTLTDQSGNTFGVDNLSFGWAKPSIPAYSCSGFQSPFNVPLALNKKTNRAIPLKAQLFDSSNNLVTPTTLGTAPPPVVNISYSSGTSTAVDDTSLLDPLGASSSGNQFAFDASTETWWFNLAASPFTASGTYTVTMQSGDTTQYQVSPQCSGFFVRQ